MLFRSGIIYLKNEYTKNKKAQAITIPDNYMPTLIDHIKKANNSDYLFSNDNYSPGQRQLDPKRISDEWTKLRNAINIPKEIVWYHLKDTGITELLLDGVPTIKVRDQARHYSIVQTEEYTPKEIITAEAEIKFNSNCF